MWGIFWTICWKSVVTWLVIKIALGILRVVFAACGLEYDQDSTIGFINDIWCGIGVFACVIAFIIFIVMTLITLWN